MDKLVLVDGNSIMNRAFYGIMGSRMLTTKDGTYTNAVYGFLAILFKLLEDVLKKILITNVVTKRFTVDKKVKKNRFSEWKDKLSKDKKENKKIEENVEKKQNLDR